MISNNAAHRSSVSVVNGRTICVKLEITQRRFFPWNQPLDGRLPFASGRDGKTIRINQIEKNHYIEPYDH